MRKRSKIQVFVFIKIIGPAAVTPVTSLIRIIFEESSNGIHPLKQKLWKCVLRYSSALDLLPFSFDLNIFSKRKRSVPDSALTQSEEE